MWRQENDGELRGDIRPCLISFDSLLQETPIIASKKLTVQLADTFEAVAFKPGFKIVKFFNFRVYIVKFWTKF